jgi:hypothetical protein
MPSQPEKTDHHTLLQITLLHYLFSLFYSKITSLPNSRNLNVIFMENNFEVYFFLKKSKRLLNGDAPIYIRLALDGKRLDYATRMSVRPEIWDSDSSLVAGTHPLAEKINMALYKMREDLKRARTEIDVLKEPMTLDNIRARTKGEVKVDHMYLQLFDKHNKRCKELCAMGKDYAPATVQRYETARKHVCDFIKMFYKKEDYPIKLIDYKFIKDYEYYLKKVRNCDNNTTIHYIRNFKKIINVALAENLIERDPFIGIKYHMNEVEVDFLEEEELEIIRRKAFEINRVAMVRDIYVFCCFTGLAFSDVKELSTEHLKTGIIKHGSLKNVRKHMSPV